MEGSRTTGGQGAGAVPEGAVVPAHALLSEEQERRLAQAAADGDAAARARLIEGNARLVASIARGYQGRGVAFDDLHQEGMLGLARAVDRFDPAHGARLASYATPWIRAAVGEAVARSGRTIRLPAGVRRKLGAVMRAQEELAGTLRRAPSEVEIADHAGLPLADVTALLAIAPDSSSLDEPMGEEGGDMHELLPSSGSNDLFAEVADGELRALLDDLIAELPPDERQIVTALGMGTVDYSSLARHMDVSLDRLRRIEMRALARLRRHPALLAWFAARHE